MTKITKNLSKTEPDTTSDFGPNREFKQNWRKITTTIVIALVMLGMVGWGLIQSIFTQEDGFVAKVGQKMISEREFYRYLENIESQFLRMGLKRPDQELLFQTALDELSMNKMIEQEMESLGLSIDDKAAAKLAINESKRNGGDGISAEQLESLGEENPELLKSILDFQRRKLFLESIQPAIMAKSRGSKVALGYAAQAELEERTYTILHTSKRNIKITKVPTDADLIPVYEANIDKFTLPSSKEVSFFKVSSIKLKDLTDEEALEHYKRQAAHGPNETIRDVELFIFDTSDEAEKAHFLLQNGGGSDKVKKAIPTVIIDKLKGVSRNDLRPELANEVFGSGANKPTKVVFSADSFVIGVTTKIKQREGTTATMPDIASIRKMVQGSIQCEKMSNLKSRIMEMASSGMSFKSIAQQTGASVGKIVITEKNGTTQPDGQTNRDGLRELGEKALSDISSNEQGYIGIRDEQSKCDATFFHIDAQNAPQTISFARARDRVMQIWLSQEIERETAQSHARLIEALSKGGFVNKSLSIEGIAGSNASVVSKGNIASRKTIHYQSITQDGSFARKLFGAKVGQIVGPFNHTDEGLISVIVDEIRVRKENQEEAKRSLAKSIASQRSEDYTNAYQNHLRSKYKISVYGKYKDQIRNN